MVSISTWNVNSVNAHLEQINAWIANHNPDIILLQETKCEDVKFPYQEFESYNVHHNGQKTYNGVAILSKFPLEDVVLDFPGNPVPEQARFIEANILTPAGLIKVVNLYIPNGSEVTSDKFAMKLVFLENLTLYLKSLDTSIPTIIGGDFNIAPFDIDVYSPEALKGEVLFTDEEKALMRKILNSNFFDLYRLAYPQVQEFSWWGYRGNSLERNEGFRIDFLLANPLLANLLQTVKIQPEIRRFTGKCSDHVPVIATFAKK